MRNANTDVGLSLLSVCETLVSVERLNTDKSEVLFGGTGYQLQAASAIKSVAVASSSLSITEKMKTLGVILNSRLTFENHVSSVIHTYNYHAQAIRHIRDLLDQSKN